MEERRPVWKRDIGRGATRKVGRGGNRNRKVGRGGNKKVAGGGKKKGNKATRKNGGRFQNKPVKSRRGGGGQRWGKRGERGWRKNGKNKRQGRTRLPPPPPYQFVNKTWHKGFEICGPEECEDICIKSDLFCVESSSDSENGCNKHKCVRLCGGQTKGIWNNPSNAVICHQDEKCSGDNRKCERMSVDKKEVLDGLSKTKGAVEGLVDTLAKMINKTEKNLEGLMKRGYSDFSLIHHIN